MSNIQKELSRIQKNLKTPKNLNNNFAGFKFRNAEGILEKVKPLLGDCSLVMNDSIELIGDRFYLKSEVMFCLGPDYIKAHAYARECENKKGMDVAQVTGAASSYARKYALCGLFAIDDSSEDPDTKNNADDSQKNSKPKFTLPEDYIIPFGKKYKGQRLGDVPKDEVLSFADWLETAIENREKPASKHEVEFLTKVKELYAM